MLGNRHRHTHTQTKYCNPCCACKPRVNKEEGKDGQTAVHGMHVVPCESIDDCTYKSTEMDKLLALRAKVESLQRDVGGLEAIVLNLDQSWEDFNTLETQVIPMYLSNCLYFMICHMHVTQSAAFMVECI